MDPSLRRRFDERVQRRGPDECWPWTGTLTASGYGQISNGRGISIRAHRLAFEDARGPIPDGLHVCHACDNPPCCNPAHLFAGTAADNQHDKRRKGRAARGERNNGGGKLTEANVRTIRSLDGETTAALALRFGVSRPMIRGIRNRTKWSHVA